MLTALLLVAVSETSFAQQKKKKDKKGKVTVHGEKDNDSKFNQRKSKGGDSTPAKKKKGKKAKKDTSYLPSSNEFELFYTYSRKQKATIA